MSKRDRIIYWTGFGIVIALLIIAPLVLPEFWRRFLTEILIWGLLAMSSDILIGYTGMVSFGHSAFFGLGMYGAAAMPAPIANAAVCTQGTGMPMACAMTRSCVVARIQMPYLPYFRNT